MLKWYQQPYELQIFLETLNYVFSAIFTSEVIIKLLAEGFKQYFREGWNIFDFIVAISSIIGIIFSEMKALNVKSAINLLRTFRILRILRLLKKGGKSLHMIFNTFVITVHSLINIGSLLLLIIYMYSVLGMVLFGDQKRNGIMNAYINFENFWNAFITLFTVVTGDSWNAIQTSFVLSPLPNNFCIW